MESRRVCARCAVSANKPLRSASPMRLALAMLLLALFPAFAAEQGKILQKLEWVADENALEYKVEIRPQKGGNSTFVTTSDNFVEVHLAAGSWRYRVYTYDVLGRESAVSSWI